MITAREKPIREGKKMRSYIVTGITGKEYPYLAESTDHAMDQHEAEGYPVGCGVHETEEQDVPPFIDRYLVAEAKLSDYRAANGAPLDRKSPRAWSTARAGQSRRDARPAQVRRALARDQHVRTVGPGMNNYVHQLTETEELCGVTLEAVSRELQRVLVRGDRVHIDGSLSPALAGSVARCALAGPVTFEGIGTHTGYLIFARSA